MSEETIEPQVIDDPSNFDSITPTDFMEQPLSPTNDELCIYEPEEQSICYYLVGDIGGTNTRLELFSISIGPIDYETEKRTFIEQSCAHQVYSSQDFPSLSDIVKLFYDEKNINIDNQAHPTVACFALAGAVRKGCANLTNLTQELEEKLLAGKIGVDHVYFINDFIACGYGLLVLPETDLEVLNENAKKLHGAPKAIIGAGTGLGEAYLTQTGKEYDVQPSEGGHSDFAPRSLEECNMAEWIRAHLGIERMSVERIVSGQGIENIYKYLEHKDINMVNLTVSNDIKNAASPGKVVSKCAQMENSDPLCKEAMHIFVSAYGAEAGNVGLRLLPFGGLYIAGGIAPKILPVLKNAGFISSMQDKGRMKSLLQTIPVYVIKNTAIGILGARVVARRKLRDENYIPDLGDLTFKDVENQKDFVQPDLIDEKNSKITTFKPYPKLSKNQSSADLMHISHPNYHNHHHHHAQHPSTAKKTQMINDYTSPAFTSHQIIDESDEHQINHPSYQSNINTKQTIAGYLSLGISALAFFTGAFLFGRSFDNSNNNRNSKTLNQ